jgi:cytochrome c oxidase cbb3-type subunit 3
MADMPTDFWSGWIVVLTVVSLVGLGWLIYGVYFGADGENGSESTVWDENLREGHAPAPMWWFWFILGLMVLSVVYLMLYPGLGSYAGALQWSQGGRLDESLALYSNEFDARRALLAESSVETLQSDAIVMAAAGRMYERNCAACHGPTAQGQAAMFPNLMDDDWQWGATEVSIEQTLRNGRQAVMPALGSALGVDGVALVTASVQSLSSQQPSADLPGQSVYTMYCSACHGAEGQGNSLLGAPNLSDDIWLYGGSAAAIAESISTGRMGIMPAFGERLDATQVRLLTAWLMR